MEYLPYIIIEGIFCSDFELYCRDAVFFDGCSSDFERKILIRQQDSVMRFGKATARITADTDFVISFMFSEKMSILT